MPPDNQQKSDPPRRQPSGVREYLSSIVVAIGLALLIRSTVVQAFYIPSGSMEDTLFVGDYLLANKFVYGAPVEIPFVAAPLFRLPALRDPQPWDIVIFRSKTEPGRDLIKRCIAVGGQVAPVALLPGAIKAFAVVLPFRYTLGFPIEVFIGSLDSAELALGFALQAGWIVFGLILMRVLWRSGVKQYQAVGA